ncbi:MAG TPA: hypothetical protein VJB59_07530 [Bdellovibrionota bacterium]|nr:hypothetical protein [Bdellovibrionota bacterium]
MTRTITRSFALVLFAGHSAFAAVPASKSHIVSDQAPTLCEIGIVLYGRCSMFKEIANWNGIARPYHIRIGQRLLLKKKPTLMPQEGAARLLASWRKRFGLDGEKVQPSPGSYAALLSKAPQVKLETRPETSAEDIPKIIVTQETVKAVTIEQSFESAKQAFENKDFERALKEFRAIRGTHPKFLPSWMYELRTLQVLKRDQEARATAALLIVEHPGVRALPIVRAYVNGQPSQ